MSREEPSSLSVLSALERARQFKSAYAYAAANNPFGVMNTDPQHLKDRSEREHYTLMMQWNYWKHLGLVDTEVVKFPRHRERLATQWSAPSWRRQRAASDYVDSFCCLVCDRLPELAAEGSNKVIRMAMALLAAAEETILSAAQPEPAEKVDRALLWEAAQQRFGVQPGLGRPPHDSPDRAEGNVIPWPVAKERPPGP